eukprot:SAG31_NODE_2621_length_5362_cov_5.185256_4_plen_458_part_00
MKIHDDMQYADNCYKRAKHEQTQKNMRNAEQRCLEALAVFPGHMDSQQLLTDVQQVLGAVDALVQQANGYFATGAFRDAENSCMQADAMFPNCCSELLKASRYSAFFSEASMFKSQAHFSEAVQAFAAAVDAGHPDAGLCFFEKGECCLQLGRDKEALGDFTRAASLGHESHFMLGKVLFKHAMYGTAGSNGYAQAIFPMIQTLPAPSFKSKLEDLLNARAEFEKSQRTTRSDESQRPEEFLQSIDSELFAMANAAADRGRSLMTNSEDSQPVPNQSAFDEFSDALATFAGDRAFFFYWRALCAPDLGSSIADLSESLKLQTQQPMALFQRGRCQLRYAEGLAAGSQSASLEAALSDFRAAGGIAHIDELDTLTTLASSKLQIDTCYAKAAQEYSKKQLVSTAQTCNQLLSLCPTHEAALNLRMKAEGDITYAESRCEDAKSAFSRRDLPIAQQCCE